MKPHKILLSFTFVVVVLALLCILFPEDGIQIGKLTLRMPTLKEAMHNTETLPIEVIEDTIDSTTVLSKRDSILLAQSKDSARFWYPNDDIDFFKPLYEKLSTAQQKGKVIRILHYGDSQIEMDRMTNRIRQLLQSEFGGGGPGLQPLAPIIPSATVSHYTSITPQRQSPFGDSLVVRAKGNYGPMTQSFRIEGPISATFKNRNDDASMNMRRVKLLFSNRPGGVTATLHWKDNNGKWQNETEQSINEPGVYALEWLLDSAVNQVRINLNGTGDAYGVMLDERAGVAVDNIPMRGCSGQQFCQINKEQLTAAYSQMDVGLIILQFGGNSVPYLRNEKSLQGYCNEIGRQIDRLHECCPEATILFVGPSDMSERRNGRWETYAYMEQIIEGLKNTVLQHGAAYWSIYHAMGGNGSMDRWNQQSLAGVDHVHFSQKGADLMGDRLAQALLKAFHLIKEQEQ